MSWIILKYGEVAEYSELIGQLLFLLAAVFMC